MRPACVAAGGILIAAAILLTFLGVGDLTMPPVEKDTVANVRPEVMPSAVDRVFQHLETGHPQTSKLQGVEFICSEGLCAAFSDGVIATGISPSKAVKRLRARVQVRRQAS